MFDEENRLNNYRTSPGVTYGYNGDGLRAWKQVGTDTYYYLYDGEQLVCEYKIVSGDLHLQNFYTWGADGLFNKVTPDDTSQLFYLYDPQGSVAVQIDDSEDERNYSIFDAWGNLVDGTTDNVGYNGKYGYYSDSDTGLVLCTHRYYDPSNGKWLTRDPIGYRGGFNLYGYVGNDAENRVDPSGYGPDPTALSACVYAMCAAKMTKEMVDSLKGDAEAIGKSAAKKVINGQSLSDTMQSCIDDALKNKNWMYKTCEWLVGKKKALPWTWCRSQFEANSNECDQCCGKMFPGSQNNYTRCTTACSK